MTAAAALNGIPESLSALAVDVEALKPYPGNPRRGDTATIAESLRVNGQYRPIVVNRRNDEVLAGNHTLAAARELGWTHIAATYVDADDEQAARIVAVDNRANDLAGYDNEALVDLLQSLPDLAGTGYDDAALAALIGAEELPPALTDPDDCPAPPTDPTSKPGDLWLLGPHRLVCGDSTDVGTYDRLLDGVEVNLVWTDPPYGVSYVGKTRDALTIKNDALDHDELTDFLRSALGAAFTVVLPGGAWYVAAPSGPQFLAFATVLTELRVWRQTIAWVKDRFVLGRQDYQWRHEAIFFGSQEGAEPSEIPLDTTEYDDSRLESIGYGWSPGAAHHPMPDRRQDTVWEVARPKRNAEHPTMKPVELITRAIENSSDRGAIVLDMFGGSGSTLIACHGTRRLARLIELDPRYVDVICRRYQEHTGTVPVLDGHGEVSFVEADGADQ